MRGTSFIFAAVAALVPFSYGSSVSADYMLERRAEEIAGLVSMNDILNAFQEAGHPDAQPHQTWNDDNGTAIRHHYIFDTDEWEKMHSSLLEKAGVHPDEIDVRDIVARSPTDPPEFYCKGYESSPFAYTYTLGAIAGSICQAFVYGAEKAGKTQVVTQHVPTVTNKGALAIFKYTWKSAQWATATSCGIAMSYGINQACESDQNGKSEEHIRILSDALTILEGAQGKQPATRGFSETYNSGLDASMELNNA